MAQLPFRRVFKTLMMLSLPVMATGEISLDAPLQDFTIPGFGKDGFPAWILKGSELHYLDKENAKVKRMNLQILSGNGDRRIETDFFSPVAKFLLKENRARGQESVQVQGDNFKITGRQWQWDGNSRTLKIQQKVKVTFDETVQLF